MKVLNRQRNSKPDWLRVMRSASRGARRSIDRGACRPAIEPRKYSNDQGADAVTLCGRQHGQARECECLFDSAWSKTLACRYALCTRTGRSPAWPPELFSERSASGRRGVEADDERAGEVRPLYSSDETGEQTWAIGRGVGGAKEEDRGEHRRATHVPDSEPESVSQGLAWVRGAARGASTLITRGGSPVRELRTPGSVRGVPSNGHPYRDRTARRTWPGGPSGSVR